MGSALLLVLAAAALGRPWEAWEELWREEPPRSAWAYVLRAVDGDTIEVRLRSGEEADVRYIGVDTPETVKPDTPVQCFGPKAHRFNSRLVARRRVRLVFGVERRDAYGRLLAYVHRGMRFVNADLVRRGFARTLTIPPNDRFASRFMRLEMAAARAGRGLWGAC
ncbi:MAG TPA: thermonuclease family protein [Solirubrobacterales bacterium]|nr:thermonuclease family protein [Solirubrobacterales bacterium]